MKKSTKPEPLSDYNLANTKFPSISKLDDVRNIFGSKEWISSYCSVFRPKDLFIKTIELDKDNYLSIGFQGLDANSDALVPIGTPYNDYNSLIPRNMKHKSNLKIIISRFLDHISGLIELGYKFDIDLLFKNDEISILNKFLVKKGNLQIVESSVPSVYCLYKRAELAESRFSKNLFKKIKYQLTRNNFKLEKIKGTSQKFPKAVRNLLSYRKRNFWLQNKSDPASAFSSKFDKLIRTFTKHNSVATKCCIFELSLDRKYVASDLFFNNKNYYLNYLRAFDNKWAKISPGMVLAYLTHKMLTDQFNDITIDYTRGDEPYKFRIGGEKFTLYRLISNHHATQKR